MTKTLRAVERLTSKQKVLLEYPKAYVKYVGLSMLFVVVNDRTEISPYRSRARDCWHAAAQRRSRAK